MSETPVLLEELAVDFESGDREMYAHYVEKDVATEAYVLGYPVIALCGKYWVPSRDPSRYPVCPTCEELLQQM